MVVGNLAGMLANLSYWKEETAPWLMQEYR